MATLEEQLIRDEGLRLTVYKDHLGKPTVGVGHLVLPKDNLKVGDKISRSRALAWFREDVKVAIKDAKIFSGEKNWDRMSQNMKNVVTNMAFNLGLPRLKQFKKMRAALDNEDYEEVANQMLDSKWARQVPNRAGRLIKEVLNEQSKLSNGMVWVQGYQRSDGSKIEGFWRKKSQ